MAITKALLPACIGQPSKNFPNLISRPSKPLSRKQSQSVQLRVSARRHNSESQQGISRAAKPGNTRSPRANFEKPAIPQRNSLSESQCCISDGDAAIGNRINLIKSQKNAVHIAVKRPAIRASNKHSIVNSNPTTKSTPNGTSKAIPIHISRDASNDNDYKENHSPVNVTTPPKEGVLLQNENTNLPISAKVKASIEVDRVSMTMINAILSPQHKEEVLRAIEDLHKADKNGLHLKKQANKRGSRYSKNYKIYFGKKYLGFLSVDPLKRTDRFLRLDFNPSKIRRSGCKIVAQAMRIIIGVNAAEVINGANITRLDIATDLHHITINNTLYFSGRPIDSSTWGKIFKHGKEVEYHYRMESQYIGSIHSDQLFVVYDKRAERIAKSRGKDDPGHDLVRVELRITPRHAKDASSSSKCSVRFDNLAAMGNPFEKLGITGIPAPDNDDGQFTLFVYAAQHVGAQAALTMLKNSRKRADYRKRLLGQAVSFWKPDEYWARAIRSLKKTLVSIS